MSEILVYILIGSIFCLVGFLLGKLITKNKLDKDLTVLNERFVQMVKENERIQLLMSNLKEEKSLLFTEKHELDIRLTERSLGLENANRKLEDQQKELLKLKEQFSKDFEILANKILEEKSVKFTAQNKENLKNILDPLQEKIQNFEKKVEESHKESIDRHASLREQILGLAAINEQMSKEAVNLTNALKGDSKTQGDWGETQLEVLLEKVGFKNGIHFSTQGGFRDEQGLLKKPDFIINLPDNKHLIVDAKVSLTAYEAYYNEEDENQKEDHLKKHLTSIKKHFKELGEKEYTELYGINTPDYVLMFVPVEPALMLALNEDKKLYLEALDRNVVLVSTSTLLATLSTVSSIWKQEDQKKNVLEIAKRAGALYDKFEGFVQDLVKVGKAINASKESYDGAMNKLVKGNGNLVVSVEKIKKLGAKAKKSIPQNILDRAEDELE